MSSYELSHEKYTALSFGLDHHIPSKTDTNLICIASETYYQSIIHKLTNLPETKISHLKTKLRKACDRYSINTLSKNSQTIVRQRNSYHGQREIHRKTYENTQYQTILYVTKRSYKNCRSEDTRSS